MCACMCVRVHVYKYRISVHVCVCVCMHMKLGVLWAQWEGWNHTTKLYPHHGCFFENVAPITQSVRQVPQFPRSGTGIIMTVSTVCGPVK